MDRASRLALRAPCNESALLEERAKPSLQSIAGMLLTQMGEEEAVTSAHARSGSGGGINRYQSGRLFDVGFPSLSLSTFTALL